MAKSNPEPVAPTNAELRSPHSHAEALGHLLAGNGPRFSNEPNGADYDWQHRAAAQLHGWIEHEHHEGKPLELSESDYCAALKAASNTNKSGDYEPHVKALSRHAALGKARN
jgi:hypothetical protein